MTKKRKTLYLVDGANYVFRAYYAMPHLSNAKGQPTGALYGFAQMLLKLVREEKPDYLAVCFDLPGPTFRDEIFEDYKANRKEPPEDLAQQFPFVRPLVEAMGIVALDKVGFEADDLIGTLAKKHEDECDVVIVSGDKDLMQLVGEHVTILDEMKGLRAGIPEVRDRFGVNPEQVIDVLGLAGDASDNIPGVNGIGIKTAIKLIQEYGSLESVIENAGKIKGVMGRKVAAQAEQARLSFRLATIDSNVSFNLHLKDLECRNVEAAGVKELFKEFEFSKLLGDVAPQKAISYDNYRLVTDEKGLRGACKVLKDKKILSLDLETTSLNTMQAEIVGISLCWAPGESAYVPVGHRSALKTGQTGDLFGSAEQLIPEQLPADLVWNHLRPILADPAIAKIGQNLNYDLTILKRLGIDVEGVAFDTMLASYVLDPGQDHSLDAQAQRHLEHRTIRYDEVTGKGRDKRNFSEVTLEEAFHYAAEDADVALRLKELLLPRIEAEGMHDLYYDMEMRLLPVLIDMQLVGVKVHAKRLAELEKDFSKRLAGLEGEIFAAAGAEFNINSPKQLGAILFEKLGLTGGKRTKTGFSTNQSVLEDLADVHPVPRMVLDYRSLSKLKGTYIDALPQLIDPATGRVHTSFNQARAATGRLSSSDPNLQNIPVRGEEGRKIREAFVAEEGFCLISADYSQIELRVLAQIARDPALVDAFAHGRDVHAITAAGIFGVDVGEVSREQRAVGKTVNFATIYGQTAFGLAKQLGIDPGEAAHYIESYFKRYPAVASLRDQILEDTRRDGFVTTLMGRRRFFPDIESSNGGIRQIAERMAFNTVFQGTAADIIKIAMIDIHAKLPKVSPESRMILQVHDELLFEAPDAEAEKVAAFAKERMEGALDLDVPLVVDVGIAKNWAEAH